MAAGWSPKPRGSRGPSLVEAGVCKHGHEIRGIEDVKLSTRTGLDGKPFMSCRECVRASERRAYRLRAGDTA